MIVAGSLQRRKSPIVFPKEGIDLREIEGVDVAVHNAILLQLEPFAPEAFHASRVEAPTKGRQPLGTRILYSRCFNKLGHRLFVHTVELVSPTHRAMY